MVETPACCATSAIVARRGRPGWAMAPLSLDRLLTGEDPAAVYGKRVRRGGRGMGNDTHHWS
ncbi:hypothetical protein GCM10022221_24930 [Actinocorallia aurea]